MYFVLSKTLGIVIQPLFWVAALWLAGLLALGRRRKSAARLLWAGWFVLVLAGFQVAPDALIRSLENRHAQPDAGSIRHHAGVIVLGGSTGSPVIFMQRGQVPLGEAAERLVVPVGLMRQHPHLTLVFSGGEGSLFPTGVAEARLAQAMWRDMGVDMRRVRLESGSRNTHENAQRVAALMGKDCQRRWLLVTSALHMPRAMAEFNTAGCNVTPYPVDYLTTQSTPWLAYSLAGSLKRWEAALHELAGLAVYALTRQD